MSKHYVPRVTKHNVHLLAMDSAIKRRWSREDMQYILLNHEEMFVEDMALELGRTAKATKDKAFMMGCSIKSKGISNE